MADGLPGRARNPTYQALRTNDHTYVEWSNGVKELYDLEADPYQLHNLLNSDLKNPPPEPATTGLAAQLAALRDCRGTSAARRRSNSSRFEAFSF